MNPYQQQLDKVKENKKQPNPYIGKILGIISIILTIISVICSVYLHFSEKSFPGIVTIILAFIPLLIYAILYFLYTLILGASCILTIVSCIINFFTKHKDKNGKIFSIISLIVMIILLILLFTGVLDTNMDFFAHVT